MARRLLLLILSLLYLNNGYAQDSLDVAYVKTKDGQWQLIDRTGKVRADSLFADSSRAVFNCNEGMVITERNGKYGFRNIVTGGVIGNSYDSVTMFRNGNAAVRIKSKWYLLRNKGLLEPKVLDPGIVRYYQDASDTAPLCKAGYCMIENDTFINCKAPDGKLILENGDVFIAPWNDVNSFIADRILKYKVMANKVCSCQKLTNYYGFIDRSGKWAIEPSFEQADIFSYGLAAVSEGIENIYTFGYIDRDGTWRIPPVYKEAGRFIRISRQ